MHKGYDRDLKKLSEAWEMQNSRMSRVMKEESGKDLIDDFEFGTLDDALVELPKTSITTGADEMEEAASDDIQKDLSFDVVDPRDLKGKKDNKGVAAQTTRLVHNSTVKGLVDEEGGEWDLEKLAGILTERPKSLLSQNGKMKKSGGSNRLFFDLSLPAYHGLFVDEKQGVFKLVKTCPSAGACKAFCYAAKGGYIQYPASSIKTGRNLNYLLNDPEGFKTQMVEEIKKLNKKAAKKGLKLSIRWHDSGDFFNEYYTDLAFSVARETPEVDHYAYTKQVPMIKGKDTENPPNFIFNYSQGGLHDKQIQPEDKQSIVIPKKLFAGLDLESPEDMETLKHNIAFKYKIDDSNIITYKELMNTPESDKPKWHVIIDPKSGDDSAVRKDVISTLLLIH